MVGVETPLMDKIIRWNQGLINKEYLTDSGKIAERMLANVSCQALWVYLESLLKGCRIKMCGCCRWANMHRAGVRAKIHLRGLDSSWVHNI